MKGRLGSFTRILNKGREFSLLEECLVPVGAQKICTGYRNECLEEEKYLKISEFSLVFLPVHLLPEKLPGP